MSEPARPLEPLLVADLLDRLASWQDPPPLYAPGSHPLWTDPYISASMLQAHLDPENDRASRRPETIDATVAWLSARLPPGARVLDLGCGPGLYTGRLAAAGFRVTGVDFSRRSIDHAREHSPGVRYLLGDYRTIALDEEFDAVLLVYLDLGALPAGDMRRILDRVRGWLAPGGVFAFDVAAPALREGSQSRRDWGVLTGGFWAGQRHAWLARTLRYDGVPAGGTAGDGAGGGPVATGTAGGVPEAGVDHEVPTPKAPVYLDEYVVVTGDQVRLYRVWERCFTPEMIIAALATAGLAVRGMYGDLAGAPYTAASPVIGVLASPA